MADPKQPPESSEDSPSEIEDAVVLEETEAEAARDASEDDAGPEDPGDADSTESAGEPDADDVTEEDGEPAEASEEPDSAGDAEEVTAEGESREEEDAQVEDTPRDATAAEEPVVIRKGGFWPALLGGVVAAGIGAGGALYLFPEGIAGSGAVEELRSETQSKLSAQADRIGALNDRIDAIKLPPDPGADLARLSDGVVQNAARLDELAAQIAAYEDRLTSMEKRPITEFASKEAVDAYERELKALQESMAKQRGEIEDMLAEAEAKETAAAVSARDALLRGALAQIQVAMDAGGSFAEPISQLDMAGVDIPETLTRMADGVPTMATLQEAFPDAARAALRASRATETDGGALKFLRDQLGVRSLEPREGGDADAILSRAEAALRAGHLADAMAELQALPEQGRVELTDWMALATQRADALAALDALSQQLMTN